MNTEELRESYKPAKVKILFVGESPPHSGEFFYAKSNMTIYTRKAFEIAFDRTFRDHVDFLGFFKENECYLDDLSHEPVNKMDRRARKRVLGENVLALSDRIAKMNPEVIVVVMKGLESYVRKAIGETGQQYKLHVLPFPGNGHQKKFIEGLTEILRKHLKGRIRRLSAGTGSVGGARDPMLLEMSSRGT